MRNPHCSRHVTDVSEGASTQAGEGEGWQGGQGTRDAGRGHGQKQPEAEGEEAWAPPEQPIVFSTGEVGELASMRLEICESLQLFIYFSYFF